MISIHYTVCILLIMIGLYTIIVKKDLIKIIIGIAILTHGVNLFFIVSAYTAEGTTPIIFANPLPHALILMAIVVSLAVTVLMAAIALRIYQYHGTFNLEKIRELRE